MNQKLVKEHCYVAMDSNPLNKKQAAFLVPDSKIACLLVCSALVLVPINFEAFALTNDTQYKFTKIEGDAIANSPVAQNILQKIEESKKILAQLQSSKPIVTEQQRLIEEQRALAKTKLDQDLTSMNKNYDSLTPKNAFAAFVSKIGGTAQRNFYWDQFNYMNEKITAAQNAKNSILQNGGTYKQAQAEYLRFVSMSRTEMITFVSETNIKYGFTDSEFQSYFDANGKLPRFEYDSMASCYSCDRFIPIVNKIIADGLDTKPNSQPS